MTPIARSIALILLCLTARSVSARAQPVAVFVGGEVDLDEGNDLREIARTALGAAGWKVASDPDAGRLDAMLGCLGADEVSVCVAEQLDPLDVERGLVVSIARAGKRGADADVKGWVYRRSGELIAVERRFCSSCGDEALRDAVRDLTTGLVRSVQAKLAPSTFALSSSPSGARVYIDGDLVGLTPVDYRLSAGSHEIRMERDGYRPETRTMEIAEGERVELDLALVAAKKDGGTRGRPLAPWLVTAGAAGLLIAGGVLIAIDEGSSPDGARRIGDTAPLGVGLAISGAVVGGVAAYLWLHHRKEGAPVAAVSSEGGYIGWLQRF